MTKKEYGIVDMAIAYISLQAIKNEIIEEEELEER